MTAGFSVPLGRQTWAAFVRDGYLPRVLTRLCALATDRAAIEMELAGDRVELRIGDDRAAIDLAAIDGERDAGDQLESAILEPLNQLLERAGIEPRFALTDGDPPESGASRGIRFGYRITLGDGDRLPSPREVVPPERVLAIDPSYPEFLARHTERLAELAGVDVKASVSASLAEMFVNEREFSLRVVVRDFMHLTLRIPRDPVDIQPIFDLINRELRDSGRQLYRCMNEPWGEVAVLATEAEAEVLRDQGDLLEPHHRRAVLERLGRAGFELEAMTGWWSTFARWGLKRCLHQFRELCRDEAALAWSIDHTDDGVTLSIPCHGAEEVAQYGAEHDEKPALEVFLRVVDQLNRALAAGEVEFRALVMTGEPLWYGKRLVLLPTDWAAQVSRFHECLSPPIDSAEPPPWPITYPRRAIDADFPRLPELTDLVPPERVCEHDFKCSARPHDFFDLVVEIGELAGVELTCEGARPGPGPDILTLEARWRGRDVPIDIVSAKYLGVGPILEAVNKILTELDDPYRLHYYRGGSYEGGLVRVTEAELAECRRYGFVAQSAAAG